MGGLAFASSGPNGTPLDVPRMPTEFYKNQLLHFKASLQSIFRNVSVPREAPGKLDHGDIDFLVEGALCPWTSASIQCAIGATYHLSRGGNHSFAVPYADSPDRYIQVDVEICPGNGTNDSTELFRWTMFMKSDSDLLQIVGICHRPLGITCNDRGLHIRVKEIESYDGKKSLLFLTRNPDEAMKFYGFDIAKYRRGFQDEHELFDWVCEGRFFSRYNFENREEKSNDRSRQKKRPLYRKFVETYMRAHPEAGADNPWTRDEVLHDALKTFGKQCEYRGMMEEHQLLEKDKMLWQAIREALPVEGNPLATVLKGLRRWVRFSDGQPYIVPDALRTDPPIWASAVKDEALVLGWIRQHWEDVKAREKAYTVSLEALYFIKTHHPDTDDWTSVALQRSQSPARTLVHTCGSVF
ncbi:hypothetical protein K491DRAFT_637728 [Lophiostoma macrostomum CBS 122681]|uniref:Uncharacterized protein n=1 Tax=Lophiostoma macrostomum CBS 122681 TaxID=1314788 RepID=A0A6A6SUL4_9PLEO|nr:hypothetical protein K491DRAFT_637728 [Lophiostoma macrostomum CBS 122681]